MEILNQAGGEKLSCSMKYFLGADPFLLDNNGNGLTDYFEVAMLHDLNISSNSSEEMALPNEDPDNDTLTNIQEQTCGTDPLNPDWDGDGLKDGDEVNIYHTNPFVTDTDNDLLDDGSEISLGMNPLKNSTYDDGILDGLRIFTTTASNDTLGISVSITGTGNMSKKVMITQDTSNYYTNSSALVSPLIHVGVNDSFNNTVLNVKYNQSIVTHPENCSLCYYNETLGVFMPVNSSVDPANHTITANVTHLSLWGVYDAYKLAKLYSKIATFNDQIAGYVEDSSDIPRNIINDPNNPITVTTVYAVDPGTNSVVKNDIVTFSNINTGVLGATPTPVPTASISTNYSLSITTNRQNTIDWFDSGAWFPTGEYQVNASGWYTHWSPPASELACIDQSSDRTVRMYAWSDRGNNYPYANVSDADRLGMRVKYSSNDSPVCAVRIQPGTLQINNTGGPIGVWDNDDNYPDDSFQLQYNLSYVGPYTPTYNVTDSDGDGLPDFVETHGFMDLQGNTYNPKPDNTDSDGDGLYDNLEAGTWTTVNGLKFFQVISDPKKVDTDGDGLDDLQESDWGTNAFVKDSDHDGLSDYEEVYGWDDPVYLYEGVVRAGQWSSHVYLGTDPLLSDSDHDGYDDLSETKGSTFPFTYQYKNGSTLITMDYVYDPLYDEKYGHVDFNTGYFEGFYHGYSETSPYKDNFYYILGSEDNCKLSELGGTGLIGLSILAIVDPAIAVMGGGIGVTIAEDNAGEVAVLEDIAVANRYELREPEIQIGEHLGTITTINDQIALVRGKLQYVDENNQIKNAYDELESAGVKPGNIVKLDEILGSNNVIKLNDIFKKNGIQPTRIQFIDDQVSENINDQGKIKTRVTIDLKKLIASTTDTERQGTLNNIEGAYSEYQCKLRNDAGGDWVIDLSHVNAPGADMAQILNGKLIYYEVKSGPVSLSDFAGKSKIFYYDTQSNLKYNAQKAITNLANNIQKKNPGWKYIDCRAQAEAYWEANSHEEVINVNNADSDAICNNLQNNIRNKIGGDYMNYEYKSMAGPNMGKMMTGTVHIMYQPTNL